MTPHPREDEAPAIRLHAAGGHFWELRGGLPSPVRLLADAECAQHLAATEAFSALRAVGALPGIVAPLIALPGLVPAHGVPLGTVVVTDPDEDGVVIPAAVGHAIGAGTTTIALGCEAARIQRHGDAITQALGTALRHPLPALSAKECDEVCTLGMDWANDRIAGDAGPSILRGDADKRLQGADPATISGVARSRGCAHFGSIGTTGAFAMLSVANGTAESSRAGLLPGEAVLIIADDSRGLGHQIALESVDQMMQTAMQHRIQVPDRALACAPTHSRVGRDYLAAMACAINFAAAHRHALATRACAAIAGLAGKTATTPRSLGDQCHQCARIVVLERDGTRRRVLMHRKGAIDLRAAPQRASVLIGGAGRPAWLVQAGTASAATLHTACHAPDGPGDPLRRVVRTLTEAGIVEPLTRLQPILTVTG